MPKSAVAVALRDPGPMARLEEIKGDEHAVNEIFLRLTDEEDPQTLTEIAKSWRVPKGKFVEWFTTEHAARYEAALKVLGGEIGHAMKKMIDGVTPETLQILKFKTDRLFRLAGHWNPRYAQKQEERSGVVPVLIIEIAGAQAEPRVVEGEVVST